MAKTTECANCGAENGADYEVCFHCLCPRGVTNEMGVNEAGHLVATGTVHEDGAPRARKKSEKSGVSASSGAESKKARRARVAREKRAAQKRAGAAA